ncbi:MAG: hypothetical protein QOK42_1831 [Frankiaceae bacterium]|jgi:hypothetical protein|nr:hypothetical protein [Frankiaceae bacterium]MDX6224950.1 hypothetical protein [Frankiales bacterium]MDX6274620.1 hypothetical protein [Frankiales bacterium]
MSTRIGDAEQISARIDGYLDGCRSGEETPLKEAFHPDARMFGAVGDQRYDTTIIPGMSAAVAAQPTGNHAARILSIDVEGDAACVKLAESGFWGQDFVDFFLLSRIEGDWQIVAKSFTHNGESATR